MLTSRRISSIVFLTLTSLGLMGASPTVFRLAECDDLISLQSNEDVACYSDEGHSQVLYFHDELNEESIDILREEFLVNFDLKPVVIFFTSPGGAFQTDGADSFDLLEQYADRISDMAITHYVKFKIPLVINIRYTCNSACPLLMAQLASRIRNPGSRESSALRIFATNDTLFGFHQPQLLDRKGRPVKVSQKELSERSESITTFLYNLGVNRKWVSQYADPVSQRPDPSGQHAAQCAKLEKRCLRSPEDGNACKAMSEEGCVRGIFDSPRMSFFQAKSLCYETPAGFLWFLQPGLVSGMLPDNACVENEDDLWTVVKGLHPQPAPPTAIDPTAAIAGQDGKVSPPESYVAAGAVSPQGINTADPDRKPINIVPKKENKF